MKDLNINAVTLIFASLAFLSILCTLLCIVTLGNLYSESQQEDSNNNTTDTDIKFERQSVVNRAILCGVAFLIFTAGVLVTML